MAIRRRGREFSPYAVTQLRAIIKALLVVEAQYRNLPAVTSPQVLAARKLGWDAKAHLYDEAKQVGYPKTAVKACLRRLWDEGRDPPDTDQAMADYYYDTVSRLEGSQAAAVRRKKSPL